MIKLTNKIVDQYSLIYLLIPLIIFFIGYLKLWVTLILVIILAVLISQYLKEQSKNNNIEITLRVNYFLISIVVLLIWVGLSGTGGFGFQQSDHIAHNTMLYDLMKQEWPLVYNSPSYLDNKDSFFLVYYIGWYLPAAIVGKLFGWHAANISLLIFLFSGIILIFANIVLILRPKNIFHIISILSIFILFGGLDFIGNLIQGNFGSSEWWAKLFQYSSTTSLIYWVPQHSVAPLLITSILFRKIKDSERSLHLIFILMLTIAILSPFGLLGIIPVVMYYFLSQYKIVELINIKYVLIYFISLIAVLPILFFYLSNKFQFPISFTFYEFDTFIFNYPLFIILEIGFLILIIRKNVFLEHISIVLISGSVLLFLPLLKMGFYNDLVMRASISSIFIFQLLLMKSAMLEVDEKKFNRIFILTFFLMVMSLESLRLMTISISRFSMIPKAENLKTFNQLPENVVIQRVGDGQSLFFKHLVKLKE